MIGQLQDLSSYEAIGAIGALGTAAFGLVDSVKAAFPFINRIGFKNIRTMAVALAPEGHTSGSAANALPQADIVQTLEANWVNGNDLGSQKAIAKTLLKLHLSVENAAKVAERTNVDEAMLAAVAAKLHQGAELTQEESDAYGRLDLIMTALIDEAYQRSDQVYRNGLRTLAGSTAVVLALAGAWGLVGPQGLTENWDWVKAVVVGLLAVPLAPVAKDLTSALASAVNAMQAVKVKK